MKCTPHHDAVLRPRLKLAAHQRPVFVDAALRAAPNLARERGAAITVAAHASVLEIDQVVRNAGAVAVADERRPGFRVGATCAAGKAIKGVQTAALHPFEHRGDALSAPDAHGHERVAAAVALQFIQRLDRKQAAGGADGVAQRHGPAVGVGLRRVESPIAVRTPLTTTTSLLIWALLEWARHFALPVAAMMRSREAASVAFCQIYSE